MDERAKAKAGALQWYVYFANVDLEHIGPGDRGKLLIEAKEHLSAKKEREEFNKLWPVFLRSKERIGALAWDFEAIDWEVILDCQKSVRNLFDRYFVWSVHPTAATPQKKDSEARTKFLRGDVEFGWVLTSGFKVPYQITLLPLAGNRNDYVSFRIIRFLDGFPSHAIRRCLSCGKYLFNSTGKIKQYCCDKCMWRLSTKKWREANPEKYRQRQRELMADLRDEKIGRKRKRTVARRVKKS